MHNPTDLSYDQRLQEIRRLLEQLRDGSLPIDQALAAYRTGTEHIRHCRQFLENAELDLLAVRPDGTTEPFDAGYDGG